MTWVRAQLCKFQKRCTGHAAACDTIYQLLAYRRWFSPGTPASSTTKIGRHDIAEILLKVALDTINQIKSNFLHTISTKKILSMYVFGFYLYHFISYSHLVVRDQNIKITLWILDKIITWEHRYEI